MPEKYAFKMMLKPGMKAEYKKRHDEIWPALVALLKQAKRPISCLACCGGAMVTAWTICRSIR